ncbi:MAG: hypothetical protein GWP50_02565, partial [Proteobacteria bacterium]|nr:hypothetical protein [Pseudomonadota bacterium]
MARAAIKLAQYSAPAMVLDCSVTMAWLFMDEANKRTDTLLTLAIEQGALVPNLWHLEVANV